VRKKLWGTGERPRLCVFRTARHIYAQIIDDVSGKTLAAASSVSKELSGELRRRGGNRAAAERVGEAISQKAVDRGIRKVVFDRNGFLYHGRVKALSEAARAGGLEF
jgi:large subunit ribosomal protein L18